MSPAIRHLRPGDLPGFDPPPDRLRVARQRTQVPGRSHAPSRQHLLHARFEFVGRLFGGVLPSVLEVYVAVPESGDDELARAVKNTRGRRKLEADAGPDHRDLAI